MKRINIIIPAYNEEARLPRTLETYVDFYKKTSLTKTYKIHIYIIDDGSSDKTTDVSNSILAKGGVEFTIMKNPENKGKGFSVKKGMLESEKADLYYFADADLSSGWEVLHAFVHKIEVNPELSCIIGSRAEAGARVKTNPIRFLLGRIAALIIDSILSLGFKDTQCGYKLFTAKCLPAFELQKIERWGFDFEILYILKLMKLPVLEVPIVWKNQEGSKVSSRSYFMTIKELVQLRSRKKQIEKKLDENKPETETTI